MVQHFTKFAECCQQSSQRVINLKLNLCARQMAESGSVFKILSGVRSSEAEVLHMKLPVQVLLFVNAIGLVVAALPLRGLINKEDPNPNNAEREGVRASGPLATHSYLQISSYSSGSCDKDVHDVKYMTLGACGPLVRGNPMPDRFCGGFVKASALPTTSNGVAGLQVEYAYFSDPTCSTVVAEEGCTQVVFVATQCPNTITNEPTEGSSVGFLTQTVTVPSNGYLTKTHLQDDCSDVAFSGQWQRNGCTQVGDDGSIHTFCSDKSFETVEYPQSNNCQGAASLHTNTPLSMCVRNGNRKIEASKHRMGYTSNTCEAAGDSQLVVLAKPMKAVLQQELLGEDPTTEPTFAPSAEPTAEPTANPTESNSDAPVSAPTVSPSMVPTVAPSVRPTAQPSTSAPTVQTSPVVSFTSTLTLTGVVSSTLDANSQYALRAASAQSMDIDISHVTYVSSTPAASVMMVAGTVITRLASNSPGPILHNSQHEDRRLTSEKQAILSDKNLHNLKRTLSGNTLSGNTLEVTTLTTISLASTSFTSVSALYDSLTDALEDAVDDGVYTTILRSSGATELAATSATDVDSDDPIVTNPPSADDSGGKSGLSDGALAGIVIGTLAGALLLFMLCYKYVSCGKSANTRDQDYLNASDHYDGSEMSSWSPLTGSRV